jgi:ectoine hydroxylase-related dioxygenase (phytanoyl-CoA dioxygenase family)
VSRPGAAAQRPHADASLDHYARAAAAPRHALFNVFVPLVDLAEGGDGTQFWPGSHRTASDTCCFCDTRPVGDQVFTVGRK